MSINFWIKSLACCLLLMTSSAMAANVVTIGQGSGFSGQTATITVSMDNDEEIAGLEFTVGNLTGDLTVTGITLAPRLSGFQTPSFNHVDSLGVLKIITFRFGGGIGPGSGPILTLECDIAPGTIPGDYDLIMEQAVLATPGAQTADVTSIDGSFTVLPRITIADYPEGQVSDQIGGGAETRILSRFQLTVAEESAYVTFLSFSLSDVAGISHENFLDLSLIEDTNGNGQVDSDETGTVGGSGSATVNGTEGILSFTTPFPVAVGTHRYILQSVVDLPSNAELTVDLLPADIAAYGDSSGVIVSSGTLSPAFHEAGGVVLSDHESGQIPDQINEVGLYENITLFRFAVTGVNDVSRITDLEFDLILDGLALQDLYNVALYEDTDDDGLPDGDPVADNPVLTGQKITFETIDLAVTDGISQSFILQGTVNMHQIGDKMEVSPVPSGNYATDGNGNGVSVTGGTSDALQVVSGVVIEESSQNRFTNQIASDGILNDVNLLQFTVTSRGEIGIVTDLAFSLILGGLTDEDLSNIELFEDIDGDGLPDGEPLSSTGLSSPALVPIGTGIVFTGLSLEVPQDAVRTFIVQMTVDTGTSFVRLTIGLEPAGVAAEGWEGNPLPVGGTAITASHRKVIFTAADTDDGQVMNRFDGVASAPDIPLYRLNLNAAGDSLIVTGLQFDISMDQITHESLSAVQLFTDADGDGSPDGTPHNAELSIGSGNIILSNLSVPVNGSRSLILTGTVALEHVGDILTIDLDPGNITAEIIADEMSGLLLAPNGEISSVTHEATGFPGDVTFDLKLDVRDVVKEVGVTLGTLEMDGPLALFDLTGGGMVNVLDVVSIIQKILDLDYPTRPAALDQPVVISLDKEGAVRIDSAYGIAGVQLVLLMRGGTWDGIALEHAMEGFQVGDAGDEDIKTVLYYNMEGNHLPAGSSDILKIQLPAEIPDGYEISVKEAIFVDASGREIPVNKDNAVFRPTGIPAKFTLKQNYPNPFNPATAVRYELPKSEHVKLTVFNLLGQKVAILVDQIQPAGRHTAVWDARNDAGRPVSSGLYLYRIQAGDSYSDVRKMLLVR